MSEESAALAAVLLAGHMLGDFVFQSRWMIERKRRASGLIAHGAALGFCQFACLSPFFGPTVVMVTYGIAASHAVVDGLKATLLQRMPARALEWFALDQILHLVALMIAWLFLVPRIELIHPLSDAAPALFTLGVLASAFAFNVNGMSCVVEAVLLRLGMTEDEGPPVGRIIGILERMFALTLVLLDRWDALGFLVAAKSLARFKGLDDRRRAEYYLVGTLLSLLGASLSALIVRALLQR